MSPHSLTDDVPTAAVDPPTILAVGNACGAVERGEATRSRLTVREMQIVLHAARIGAAARPDAVDADWPATPHRATRPSPAGTAAGRPDPTARRPRVTGEVSGAGRWLPERDGPVSLAGVSAPRSRPARSTATTPDPAARRSPRQRNSGAPTTAVLDPALVDAAVSDAATGAPPRLVVVAACGGAGASTATVLLSAALAPTTGVLLVAGGADRGALSIRANASGGDLDALTGWAAQHPGRPLHHTTPGLARGSAGTGPLLLAGAGPDHTSHRFDADTAAALLAAAASTPAAVLLDWSCPTPLPERIWASATGVLVVAPATASGVLDAEHLARRLDAAIPAGTPLGVLTVDVRGRPSRRAVRASRARLHALDLPVTGLPFDPALADDPRVHWPALHRRTRSAVLDALTRLLPPRPASQRKDPT